MEKEDLRTRKEAEWSTTKKDKKEKKFSVDSKSSKTRSSNYDYTAN